MIHAFNTARIPLAWRGLCVRWQWPVDVSSGHLSKAPIDHRLSRRTTSDVQVQQAGAFMVHPRGEIGQPNHPVRRGGRLVLLAVGVARDWLRPQAPRR